jgi:hypothetical protein
MIDKIGAKVRYSQIKLGNRNTDYKIVYGHINKRSSEALREYWVCVRV